MVNMTPAEASREARNVCAMAPVVPVLVVDDVRTAVPLAEALVAGGLPALEVTLRTPVALEAIRLMSEVHGGVVGAGTLITPMDVRAAVEAGATFGVSPGATPELIAACEAEGLPLLAGAATASEAMMLLARGYDCLKFFPAEASGGTAALKSLAGPLPQIGFCPTGGVGPGNAKEYLGQKNVLCVGGSWVAPAGMIATGDWSGIEGLARSAAKLER